MTDRQKAINSGEEWLKRGVPMTRHLTLMILLPIVLVICANCAGSPVRTHWQAETNNANMTKLKLGSLLDDKPVKLSIELPHLFIAISLPTPRCSPGKLGSRSPNPQS